MAQEAPEARRAGERQARGTLEVAAQNQVGPAQAESFVWQLFMNGWINELMHRDPASSSGPRSVEEWSNSVEDMIPHMTLWDSGISHDRGVSGDTRIDDLGGSSVGTSLNLQNLLSFDGTYSAYDGSALKLTDDGSDISVTFSSVSDVFNSIVIYETNGGTTFPDTTDMLVAYGDISSHNPGGNDVTVTITNGELATFSSAWE